MDIGQACWQKLQSAEILRSAHTYYYSFVPNLSMLSSKIVTWFFTPSSSQPKHVCAQDIEVNNSFVENLVPNALGDGAAFMDFDDDAGEKLLSTTCASSRPGHDDREETNITRTLPDIWGTPVGVLLRLSEMSVLLVPNLICFFPNDSMPVTLARQFFRVRSTSH